MIFTYPNQNWFSCVLKKKSIITKNNWLYYKIWKITLLQIIDYTSSKYFMNYMKKRIVDYV